ncbi:MAG: FAD binding domain-containing protein [Solirubrobacteraceae bacterium]
MKLAPFGCHAPEPLGEALAVIDELVEVELVEASPASLTRHSARRCGELMRQSTIVNQQRVRRLGPLIADATRLIGHFQIRNRLTVGGSRAHADSVAEYPVVTLALDADLDVASAPGTRTSPPRNLSRPPT